MEALGGMLFVFALPYGDTKKLIELMRALLARPALALIR
jgi:hypothetical protein